MLLTEISGRNFKWTHEGSSPFTPPINSVLPLMLLTEINIKNLESKTYFSILVRSDRLADFYRFAAENRTQVPASNSSRMPGLSYGAVRGITALFVKIPIKFPFDSLLEYIYASQPKATGLVDGPGEFTHTELELLLARWAPTVPQLLPDGSDIIETEV
jgi:hypothetical protein